MDGDLLGFSNDLPRKYKNNSGKINVTVRRTADSGTTSLKTCEEGYRSRFRFIGPFP